MSQLEFGTPRHGEGIIFILYIAGALKNSALSFRTLIFS
jgi:hypothetical protein